MSTYKRYTLIIQWVVFALVMFGLLVIFALELTIAKAEDLPPNEVWLGDAIQQNMYAISHNQNHQATKVYEDIQFLALENNVLIGVIFQSEVYSISAFGASSMFSEINSASSSNPLFATGSPWTVPTLPTSVIRRTQADGGEINQYLTDIQTLLDHTLQYNTTYDLNMNALRLGETRQFEFVLNAYGRATSPDSRMETSAYLRIIPVWYGQNPEQEEETIYNCWDGASELTSLEGLDPYWVARCAECIPHLQYEEEEGDYFGIDNPIIPTVEIIIELDPDKEATKAAMPTATPSIPYQLDPICESPPGVRDSSPIVDDWLDIVITESATCYTILPQISITIPSFLTLWEEFTVSVTGFELCVYWVLMPELRFLDWTLPLGALVIGVVFMFIRRVE